MDLEFLKEDNFQNSYGEIETDFYVLDFVQAATALKLCPAMPAISNRHGKIQGSRRRSFDLPGMRSVTDTVLSVLTACASPGRIASLPPPDQVLDQITRCREIFAAEPSLLDICGSFVVVGDIHGNLTDLVRIFERMGYPPDAKYVLIGDFVDRGPNSVEVMLLLFALKLLYKDHIYLVRGNHECDSVCNTFGFREECEMKLATAVYDGFVDCFTFLPFAARINGKVLCVHGGIGPEIVTLQDIEELTRPMRSYESAVSNALVWSDPRAEVEGFTLNDRGTGAFYNSEVLGHFLSENLLSLLIRGHEFCPDGYDLPFGEDGKCITVFSSSDYCGAGNSGAVVRLDPTADPTYEVFAPILGNPGHRIALLPEWVMTSGGDTRAEISELESDLDGPGLLDMVIFDSVDLFTEF
jgi:protein phosphatase